MRLNKFTLTILFSLSSIYGFSQENFPIKGKIENIKNEPIGMATIKIFKENSTELFDQINANEDGTFVVPNLNDGKYKLVIAEFGYEQLSTVAEVKGGVLDLGNIILKKIETTETVELKGAFVRAKTSQYRNEIDKRVVEVGNDLVNAGTDAASVLNNIPSVNVDPQSGNLSLRGNSNVKVYVDGKPSSLSPAQLLKQIPSDQIQRIEIITNPSAKYEADGKSGIINIILVKGAKKGYNIGLTTGYEQGKKSRFNSSVNTNVNVGKFNIFGNVNYAEHPNKQILSTQDYTEKIDQSVDIINRGKNLSYKVGVDFFINDKNSLTIYTNQWNINFNSELNTSIFQSNANKKVFNDISAKYNSSDYSLNYKLDFDKKDHNIILDAFYSKNNEKTHRNYLVPHSTNDSYNEFLHENIKSTRINLDYTNQIENAGKIEAGVQYRNESSINNMISTQNVSKEGITYNPLIDFDFDRSFYSAYANYKQQFNKFGAQVGLRLENVEDKINWAFSPNKNGNINKKYTDLFPSVFLTYDLTEKAKFSLNYSRRIDRPGIYQLTPITQFSTPLISAEGNPNLKPEYTDSYELGYLHQLKKGTLSANLFYRNVKDNIIQSVIKNPNIGSTYIFNYLNYNRTNNYGAELSWNYNATKWMKIFLSGDFTSSEMQNEIKKITANILSLRMNNTYTINKQFSLQQFVLFRGRNKNLQQEVLDMWKMDLGLRYTFMDGKASLTARMNDIFKTMRFKALMTDPQNVFVKNNWESQTAYLGFTYNFGGKVRTRTDVQKNENKNSGGGIGL